MARLTIVNSIPKLTFTCTEPPLKSDRDLLLDSLDFPERTWRYQDIRPADRSTFKWVFDGEAVDEDGDPISCPSLMKWLRGRDAVYWITGKPGSGKSTVMKEIVSSGEFAQMSKCWVGGSVMKALQFFLWRPGTNVLQKSLEGLLRSLLWQVVEADSSSLQAVLGHDELKNPQHI